MNQTISTNVWLIKLISEQSEHFTLTIIFKVFVFSCVLNFVKFHISRYYNKRGGKTTVIYFFKKNVFSQSIQSNAFISHSFPFFQTIAKGMCFILYTAKQTKKKENYSMQKAFLCIISIPNYIWLFLIIQFFFFTH